MLFISGQYHRWQQSQVQADEWRNKLKETYVSALGPNPGSDPYGKILYKLDQLKAVEMAEGSMYSACSPYLVIVLR